MSKLKPLLKIAISLALIAIILRAFDVKDVGVHLAKVDALTLFAATALAFVVTFLHTARWMTVLEANGTPLAFKAVLRMVLIGLFFNQALPSSVGGDAVRVWCAYRGGLAFSSAARTVIVDRALTLLALLLLSALGLPWLFRIITEPVAHWALAIVIAAGLTTVGVFLTIKRLPHFMSHWRAARALLGLAALARTVLSNARYASVTILASVAGFIIFALIVFMIAHAMQLGISFRNCVLLVPPVILVTVVPLSIGGWGVREGAMVVAFGFIGVAPSAAFATSALFALTVAVASLPGAIVWWLAGYKLSNVAARMNDD